MCCAALAPLANAQHIPASSAPATPGRSAVASPSGVGVRRPPRPAPPAMPLRASMRLGYSSPSVTVGWWSAGWAPGAPGGGVSCRSGSLLQGVVGVSFGYRWGVVARLSDCLRSACRPAGGARCLAPLAMRALAPPSVPLRSVGTCAVARWRCHSCRFRQLAAVALLSAAIVLAFPPLYPRFILACGRRPFWAWCGVRWPPPAPRPSAVRSRPVGDYLSSLACPVVCLSCAATCCRQVPQTGFIGHFRAFWAVVGSAAGAPTHAAASALVSAGYYLSSLACRLWLVGYYWVSSGFFWVFGFFICYLQPADHQPTVTDGEEYPNRMDARKGT